MLSSPISFAEKLPKTPNTGDGAWAEIVARKRVFQGSVAILGNTPYLAEALRNVKDANDDRSWDVTDQQAEVINKDVITRVESAQSQVDSVINRDAIVSSDETPIVAKNVTEPRALTDTMSVAIPKTPEEQRLTDIRQMIEDARKGTDHAQ